MSCPNNNDNKEDIAVTKFREYLRIKTVPPNHEYEKAIQWLETQAKELKLKFRLYRFQPPNEFAVVITWEGSKGKDMKSILLNSHIDVVPVDETKWTYKPFEATKANGKIYARGAQDMKCVGVQYLEAIRLLKNEKFQPVRDIHVSFVPDEEVGGYKGMGHFVTTKDFDDLNIGFALDEGIANPEDSFHVFYGERCIWQFKVTAEGATGHASILHNDTAAEKLFKVMNKLLSLRDQEKMRLAANRAKDLGDVTSINMTMLEGGLQPNVVPPQLSAVFDMRITPHWDLAWVQKFLDQTIQEAGPNVSYSWIQHSTITEQTSIEDSNIWWKTFKDTMTKQGYKINARIFPAGTDIVFVRQVLLHDHDEYLDERVFLEGVKIYTHLIRAYSSLGEDKKRKKSSC